jgi:nitrite reductase (NADH) large subunit
MRYLIIGNGIAGVEAAINIRKIDKEGDITIITKSENLFYFRPRLIDYLANKVTFKEIIAKQKDFYEEKRIKNVFNTKVTGIRPETKNVIDSSGITFKYDKLLLATGAKPFLPPIDGIDKKGVFTFRQKKDADNIKLFCKDKKDVVIIGGGLLGLEVANSLTILGKKVTIIEYFNQLLPRQLDEQGAEVLKIILERKGLSFELGNITEKIDGKDKVERVILKSGEIVKTDAVIISAGIRPRLELAKDINVKINKGIKVNDYMETSIKDIYAAGDIAEHRETNYGLWIPSKEQGEIAGKNMAGEKIKYKGSSFETRLKVTGITLFSAGEFNAKDGEIKTLQGDDVFKKIIIKNKKLYGAIILGDDKAALLASKIFKDKKYINMLKEIL